VPKSITAGGRTVDVHVRRLRVQEKATLDSARASDRVLAETLDELISDPDPAVQQAVLGFFDDDTQR
jgi:hypothetical protein